MAVVSSFPLLRLPKKAMTITLRIMDHLQLFGISLASEKARDFVQSLKIKASEFAVYITDGFTISLMFSGRSLCFISVRSFPKCQKFSVEYKDVDYRWSLNEMDERMSINHLKVVFNCSKIKVRFGNYSEQFDFEPFLKGRQDIELISSIDHNRQANQRILDVMKPSQVSMIELTSKYILLQNFDYLAVSSLKINLDTLLMMNTRSFQTFNPIVPTKVFNQFLKLWLRGSNPQLESLEITFLKYKFKKEEIFDRLKVTQNNTVRYFKSSDSKTHKIFGGTDISRFDGTKATINTNLCQNGVLRTSALTFEMFVWHDHCVAKKTD